MKQTSGTCTSGAKISVGFTCGGIVGASGSSASLTLGDIVVNTLTAGSDASLTIVNSETSLNDVWNMTFGLPIGATGATGQTGQTGSDGKDGQDGQDYNYGTVAAMIAANDVVITAAYVLAISAATTPLSTVITALTNTVAALTTHSSSINR